MKCVLCQSEFDEKSGRFMRHLKDDHNISSISEYFYQFHDPDPCEYCGTENKKIVGWKFEKKMFCHHAECSRRHVTNGAKRFQLEQSKAGTNNFQKPDVQQKARDASKKMMQEGKLFSQSEEGRKLSSEICRVRNATNNPMKNEEIAKKMAESSRGKILSDEHRDNIGKGLSKYLSSLSDEDFKRRMENTYKTRKPIMDDSEIPIMNLSLEEFFDTTFTDWVLEEGRKYFNEKPKRTL